ncbi:MAG: divalent-cation tolerance protein CutA [Candidatus Nanohaloarchaeota archaeon]|nr:divalent-cation tolerance protein CutA [Candidatus Nanohaloarchaeota archaeon]
MNEKYYVVITTVDDEEIALKLTNLLLHKRLVACVNIISNVTSKYWWKGQIEESKEFMLIMKTREELVEKVKHEILVNHPYEVAEVMAFEAKDISLHYASWIDKETNKVL